MHAEGEPTRTRWVDTLTHHREKNSSAEVDPRCSPGDVIGRSKCSGYRDPRVPAGEKDIRLADLPTPLSPRDPCVARKNASRLRSTLLPSHFSSQRRMLNAQKLRLFLCEPSSGDQMHSPPLCVEPTRYTRHTYTPMRSNVRCLRVLDDIMKLHFRSCR